MVSYLDAGRLPEETREKQPTILRRGPIDPYLENTHKGEDLEKALIGVKQTFDLCVGLDIVSNLFFFVVPDPWGTRYLFCCPKNLKSH
jgi:hypothetical protein